MVRRAAPTSTTTFMSSFQADQKNTSDASQSDTERAAADPACAEEPIRIPGDIQPHGCLLAIDPERNWTVVAASRNTGGLLHVLPSAGVLGRGIASLLGQPFAAMLQQRHETDALRGAAPWRSTIELPEAGSLDTAAHSHAGLVLVELEPVDPQADAGAKAVIRQLQEIIVALRTAGGDLDQLALVVAHGVRLLTGYERVVVYRFDSDWNGEAIAEDKVADWNTSLSGLRFPASDIPSQARELYRHSPLRWVPDRDAAPAPLDTDPAWNAAAVLTRNGEAPARTVDLSFAYLRSLSPVHLDIHRGLGINGSMSLSILHQDRLWGLLVCHHRQAHRASSDRRVAATALTDAFALRVGPVEHVATERARREDVARLLALLAQMAAADDVTAALTAGAITIDTLLASTGAAVLYGGTVSLLGHTPPEADVREMAAWLRAQDGPPHIYQTNHVSAVFPSWDRHTELASGMLAIFLSDDRTDMLLWFRPAETELVTFGGSSRRVATNGAASALQNAYEKWTEVRRGMAKPWAEWELAMAETLRQGISDVMLRSLRRIADLNDRLRQSQKMEAVGQLTGGIAHDFNNLLAGILGSLELIQMRMAQGRLGDMSRYLELATASANRAASLTHRLLAFSRRQTLDPRSVDVRQLTTSMEDLIRRTVGPAIRVDTMILSGLWQTLCDANQLENALLNLAINARDAMPEGGYLTIEGGNATLDEADAVRHETTSGQYVTVSVTDTGCGMTPEVISRVFEPFFTTKPLGQGTGLGLSMVYGFAKQSNGHTQISSEVGRGTTVRLYLPRFVEIDGMQPGAPDTPAYGGTGKSEGTVLVVDDEPALRLLIGDVLREQGYYVVEAADGREGLGILQSIQRIDLLVSDVGLPGG